MLSTTRFSPLPAPPGFAPISPPGSLAVQSVIVDTMSLDLSSPIQPVSLLKSGPLSSGRAQSIVLDTSVVRNILSSPVPIAAVDSPVELKLTGRSPPLATAVPDECSSPIDLPVESPIGVAKFDAVGLVLL